MSGEPGYINVWFCPACGERMAGRSYSVDEARKRCTKTIHRAIAQPRKYVPVSQHPQVGEAGVETPWRKTAVEVLADFVKPASGPAEGCLFRNALAAAEALEPHLPHPALSQEQRERLVEIAAWLAESGSTFRQEYAAFLRDLAIGGEEG